MAGKRIMKLKKKDKVKFDSKDNKILYLLSEDGKLPVTEIAKEVSLSKDAVAYRINRLIESGVITGFMPIIDVAKFGFHGYYLYLKLENLTKDTDVEILNYLKDSKYTMVVESCFGNYDVLIQIFVRSRDELDVFMRELRDRYDNQIHDFVLLITTKEYKLPAKYLMDSEGLRISLNRDVKSSRDVTFDQIDRKILKMLSFDAKTPTYKIANEINLSSDAVIYRIKRLLNVGIIERFMAVIDVSRLGYHWHVILFQLRNLTDEKEGNLVRFVKSHSNMLYLSQSIGKYDFSIDVNARDEKHFNSILMELRVKFHDIIKSYDTILVFKEYKYTYFPEILWD